MPGGRSTTPEESDRIRVVLRRILEECGTRDNLAKRLGASPQLISHVLNGGGVGLGFARKVADDQDLGVDELLGGRSNAEAPQDSAVRNKPGFAAAVTEALQRWPNLSEQVIEKAGIHRGADVPNTITADYLYDLCNLQMKWAPRADAEQAEAKGEIEKERAKRKRGGK